MYKCIVNDKIFDVETIENKIVVNDFKFDVKTAKRIDGGFDITINSENKIADIVNIDKEQKIITIRIENKKYSIQIKEPIDLLLENLGINIKHEKKINNLKAPMPGLISKILVAKGDIVKQGEPLLVLEAMKMENVFKASHDVTIKSLNIQEKQAVEKGAVLIEFE